MKKLKIILMSLVGMGLLGAVFAVVLYFYLAAGLPDLFSVEDYKPDLVSEVFARDGEKIGEFSTGEYRKLVPVDEIPENLKNAFISAEDSSFYSHNGFNFIGIIRAVVRNTMAGSRVQGASTITQQTARTLFLTSERTYTRKLKEAIMAQKMEANLSKDEILYLYLNQVYFGQRAYGVASAADTYFRKEMKEMTLAEMAMLGGLLTAPSRYNPVSNPEAAKMRQLYVLKRMLDTERITQDQYDVATSETLTIYQKKKFKDVAPYFVETIRLLLNKELGEDQVKKNGLQVFSSLDYTSQIEAQASVRKGLRDLDKRQGFRGPKRSLDITNEEEINKFLSEVRDGKIAESIGKFELYADGSTSRLNEFELFQEKDESGEVVNNVPTYLALGDIVEGVVTDVNSSKNVVFVRFAEAQGIIPLQAMEWARPRNLKKRYGEHLHIKSVGQALKKGDVVDVRIVAKTAKNLEAKFNTVNKLEYAELALEQEPEVEGALLSFDLKTDDIIAMVGGSNFRNTKYNRAYQTHRQTGSAIKPVIYAAGLDNGLTPATPIMGAPIVYTHEEAEMDAEAEQKKLATKPSSTSTSDNAKVWKPSNYGGRFSGDMLLRNCLKKSKNTSTIRVLEKAGINFAAGYAKRMGIFSPINMDMSMALGSSGISLYEMTKVFSIFARLGKNIKPIIIHEVKSHSGDQLLQSVSFDMRFSEELEKLNTYFEEKKEKVIAHQSAVEKAYREAQQSEENPDPDRKAPKKSPWLSFFNNDPEQLISPQTAFLITNILQAAVNERGGTGVRAQRLGREVAGKTGTTDGYYDAWFMGFTPQVTTGVWVGFDQEKTLGPGESGGKAALPIWLEYMQGAMKDLPKMNFQVPPNIVFANIDSDTGHIANSDSHEVVRQAFVAGTEPGRNTEEEILKQEEEDKTDFLREDF